MSKLRGRTAIAVVLLACAGGAAAHASSRAGVRTIVLTIHHSHFSLSTIDVKRGETVRFVVHNTDPIDHELIVGPWPVQLMHEAGKRKWHPPVPGEVSVHLLSIASTTYTFPNSGGTDDGPVLFGCHLPGHWAYGMHGRFVVR